MQLSMSGYLFATLSKYIHTKLPLLQDSPYPWVVPQHGINGSQIIPLAKNSPDITKAKLTKHHKIIGTLLSYFCAVGNTMLMALNSLVAYKNNVTENAAKHLVHFLNYRVNQPKVSIYFQRSDIILYAYSYVLYLSESKVHSQVGKVFFLGTDPLSVRTKRIPTLNGPINIQFSIT